MGIHNSGFIPAMTVTKQMDCEQVLRLNCASYALLYDAQVTAVRKKMAEGATRIAALDELWVQLTRYEQLAYMRRAQAVLDMQEEYYDHD